MLLVVRALLPPGHILPGSLYMCKAVIAYKGPEMYEQHACRRQCHCFPYIQKHEYLAHKDDCCPVCNEPRFEYAVSAIGNTMEVANMVIVSLDVKFGDNNSQDPV
jgi:hypothetical protein